MSVRNTDQLGAQPGVALVWCGFFCLAFAFGSLNQIFHRLVEPGQSARRANAATRRSLASSSLYCSSGFFAMPRDSWVPLPHEADLFHEVYIDESSQTKHRYMVLGGLCIPFSHSAHFEADIIAQRGTALPIARDDGTPRVMKWEKVNARNLDTYKRLVDAYFTFPMRYKLPLNKSLETHCLAVDTSKKTLKDTGEGDIEIGFAKEFYFLCVPIIGKRLKTALFHLYPDRRTTTQSLIEARNIMNAGARKYGDNRTWPYRELKFQDPEMKQALQIVDILIGAIAFRLNGHYQKP
jgi:hypothetical protein